MRIAIFRVAVLLLTAGGLFLTACGTPEDSPRPRHVILIVIDTMRGDHLGCSGGPVATPNLDALAADGVRFTQARSTAPITGPSHASIFTGLYPNEHGVTNNGQVLNQRFLTMAEIAKGHGYGTAAFVSLGVLRGVFGYGQGFDTYDHRFDLNWWRNAAEINAAVIPWVENTRDAKKVPQFLWVHYSDPHSPYAAPGRPFPTIEIGSSATGQWQTVKADGGAHEITVDLQGGSGALEVRIKDAPRRAKKKIVFQYLNSRPRGLEFRAGKNAVKGQRKKPNFILRPPSVLEFKGPDNVGESATIRFILKQRLKRRGYLEEYGAEVEFVDREIGRLIEVLKNKGWYDDSLIVVAGDHGEGLGDHALIGHIHQLYDSLLHVPLLVVAPGQIPKGVVVKDPVSTLDILPTIAELVGFDLLDGQRGQSLVPLMHGRRIDTRPHFAMTARPQAKADLDALIDGGLKLIRHQRDGRYELYDLGDDPGELTDRTEGREEAIDRMRQLLDEIVSESTTAAVWLELDEETRSKLEALGYTQ